MEPRTRYFLLQTPGYFVALVLLGVAALRQVIPPWLALALFVLWIVKDIALYPVFRRYYDARGTSAADQLVGARGITVERLAPRGYVRVGSELWRAELRDRNARLEANSTVTVAAVRGLTLIVDPS
ncbi:MAG: NfeD family protein [Acidobacteria bacterium]|nr:NfeD family protein [Acidobacteriota bacterium]